MGTRIEAIGCSKPKLCVDNEAWRERFAAKLDLLGTEFGRLISEGVVQRHYWAPDQTVVEVAQEAIRDCLEKCDTDVAEIDLLIHASNVSDSIMGDSTRIQEAVGAMNAASYELKDVNCAGSMIALLQACAFVDSGMYRKVLVSCVANGASRAGNMGDFLSSALGDLATAFLVVKSQDGDGLLGSCHTTLGRCHRAIEFSRRDHALGVWPQDHRDRYWANLFIGTDREFVPMLTECLRTDAPRTAERALAGADKCREDVDWLITHQAGGVMKLWREALGFDAQHHLDTFDDVGNSSMSNIPYTLLTTSESGVVSRGDLLLLLGAGSGMQFVSAVWKW
jgi:3-oxoacyl-[acyl-carrier-protein] synthase III